MYVWYLEYISYVYMKDDVPNVFLLNEVFISCEKFDIYVMNE